LGYEIRGVVPLSPVSEAIFGTSEEFRYCLKTLEEASCKAVSTPLDLTAHSVSRVHKWQERPFELSQREAKSGPRWRGWEPGSQASLDNPRGSCANMGCMRMPSFATFSFRNSVSVFFVPTSA
jgi:hypothetical protein